MATPHVTGVVALLLSQEPSLTPVEIRDRLIRSSDPVKALRYASVSRGRVNAQNAIHGVFPKKDTPENGWSHVSKAIESAHPYAVKPEPSFNAQAPGAQFLRVHFDRMELDPADYITIENSKGEVVDFIPSILGGTLSDYVEGDSVKIQIRSNEPWAPHSAWGFSVDHLEAVY